MPAPDAGGGAAVGFPDVVHLSVGGTRYTTTLGTLRRDSRSKLYQMFSGQIPISQDSNGVFFIDRAGRPFAHILNFLRDGSVPLGLTHDLRLELLRECLFYGLGTLHDALGSYQDPRSPGCVLAGAGIRGPVHARPPAGQAATAFDAPVLGALPEAFPEAVRKDRFYVRLRYGYEYSGDWIVSSPRNLPGVDYELHDACLARGPISAMNRLAKAGFRPCTDPPRAPSLEDLYTDKWDIVMYKDFIRGSEEWKQWKAGRPSSQVLSPRPPAAATPRRTLGVPVPIAL